MLISRRKRKEGKESNVFKKNLEQAIKTKYLRIITDHKFELSKQHKLRD